MLNSLLQYLFLIFLLLAILAIHWIIVKNKRGNYSFKYDTVALAMRIVGIVCLIIGPIPALIHIVSQGTSVNWIGSFTSSFAGIILLLSAKNLKLSQTLPPLAPLAQRSFMARSIIKYLGILSLIALIEFTAFTVLWKILSNLD